jgi:hypothetical protein
MLLTKNKNTMDLIREIFKCKPGKAKEMVKIFKKARPYMEKDGFTNGKIMTDFVAEYWTVVFQYEVKKLDQFADKARGETSNPELGEIFKGYMDLLEGGKREIYLLEETA